MSYVDNNSHISNLIKEDFWMFVDEVMSYMQSVSRLIVEYDEYIRDVSTKKVVFTTLMQICAENHFHHPHVYDEV